MLFSITLHRRRMVEVVHLKVTGSPGQTETVSGVTSTAERLSFM